MRYRITPGYGGERFILWTWHRGGWCIHSYHSSKPEAQEWAKQRMPDGECVDPELVKAMRETVDE